MPNITTNNTNTTAKSDTSGIDRFTHIAMLYDFYAPLLTKKQCEIIEMYFMHNLSLSEIAELSGITRQAVSILLNRTEKLLYSYEDRLKLADTYKAEKNKLKAVEEILCGIINSPDVCDSVRERLRRAILCLSK